MTTRFKNVKTYAVLIELSHGKGVFTATINDTLVSDWTLTPQICTTAYSPVNVKIQKCWHLMQDSFFTIQPAGS